MMRFSKLPTAYNSGGSPMKFTSFLHKKLVDLL